MVSISLTFMVGILHWSHWSLVVLLCAYIALQWARLLTVHMSFAVKVLVAGLLGEIVAGTIVAWLGLFGLLSPGSQLALLVALAAVTRLATGLASNHGRSPAVAMEPQAPAWAVQSQHRSWDPHAALHASTVISATGLLSHLPKRATPGTALSVAALALTTVAGGLLSLNQIRYISTDADSMFYHLPMVAEWVRTGSIWPTDTIKLVARAYPGFKEAALAALSLSLRNEHLALWAPIEYGLLALVTYSLARHFGARWLLALAAMAYAVTVPVVASNIVDQGDTDILAAIATCTSVLFLSMLVRRPGWQPAVLAGLALGATTAVKFSGLIYAGIVIGVAVFHGLFILCRHPTASHSLPPVSGKPSELGPLVTDAPRVGTPLARDRGSLGESCCRITLLVLVGVLIMAGPWYARNCVAYGNPLYPAEVRVAGLPLFAGPMSQAEVASTALGWHIAPLVRHARYFVDAFGLLVPLLGLSTLWLAIASCVRKQHLVRIFPLVFIPPLLAIAFLHHPYNKPSPFGSDYNMRYLIPCFVLCTCGMAAGVARCRKLARILAVLLLLGAVWNLHFWTRYWWMLAGFAAVTGCAAITWLNVFGSLSSSMLRRESSNSVYRQAATWLLLGVILVSSGWVIQRMRTHLQYAPGYGYDRLAAQPGWGPIVAHVHRNIRNRRIAVCGDILLFPIYGDDFSNTLYPVYGPATAESILASCNAEGLDFVAVFQPRGLRTAADKWERGKSIAVELLQRYPDRFAVVMEASGSFLLRAIHD